MPTTPEIREVAALIGQFYLRKHEGDYVAAEKAIVDLRISDLTVEGDKVTIVTARPGMLIGRRGTNIDELTAFLNKKVHIIEDVDPLIEYLIPQPEEPIDEYDYLDWPTPPEDNCTN
jgi:hypothetical protein